MLNRRGLAFSVISFLLVSTLNRVAVTLVLTTAFVVLPGLWAQTSRGSISGTVTDQTGAVIPNTTVTIVKDGTGATRETQTNNAGLYRFDAVDLGTYTVTVKAPAFAPSVTKNVPVAAARDTALSVKLAVGTTETVMTVESTSEAVLQTTEQVRGGTFTTRTVSSLPLQGLDSLNVILLNPGAVAASTTAFSNGSNQYSVNGSRARSNNFMIDGVENNDISVAGPAFQLTNQDAVQEVSVQTSNFSSEFGRAGGGVINQVIKSGTNSLHGTAEHIYLSQVFNASDNLERFGCTDPDCRAKFVENIPAFTIGGPVYIPHIYDGRNKTHFFAAGQWDRFFSSAVSSARTIPTAEGLATLQGLAAACTAAGTNLGTYLGILTGSGIVAPSFTAIPLFGATAANPLPPGYADLRLAVTTGGCGGDNRAGMGIRVGPFQRTASQFSLDQNYQIRIDHIASQKQTMSFRWLYDKNSAGPFFNNLPGFDRGFDGITLTGAFADTYMISPRLTNEFRFNYGRIGFNFPLSDPGGLAGTLPAFSMTGVTGFGGATNIPQFRFANNWQYQDTVSWTHGKHQFRFGADFLRQLARQHPPFNERGSISFVNSTVGGSLVNRGFANFIDDFGGNSTAGVSRAFGSPAFQGVYYPNLFRQAYFFNDSWKIRQNLTLNLGLRYENFGQPANIFFHPAFDNYSTTEFDQQNRVNQDNNNFGPSFGFAWNPNFEEGPLRWLLGAGKTVIRGGYGISYDAFFNNILSNIAGSSPNTLGGSLSSASSVAATPRGTANWFSATFPLVTATPPTAASDQANLLDPNIRNPYTQHFSLGVQRELPSNTIMEVAYVGSLGRKLFQTVDMNPRAGFDANGVVLPRIHLTDPICGTASATNRARCLRTIRASTGRSNYNALQISVRRGYSSTPVGSLSIAGAYTWSHGFDDLSEIFGTDSTFSAFGSRSVLLGNRPDADYASNDFDIRHRGVINWVWDIRGPQRGVLGQVLGGWGVAGVVQLQTGAPFTLRNGFDRDGDGRGDPERPNVSNPNAPLTSRGLVVSTAVCASGLQDVDSSTGACTTPDQVHWIAGGFLLGSTGITTGRNSIRFPYTQRWDFSLTKKFRLGERFQLQYRAELLNALNRQNFGVDPGGGNQPARTVGGGPGDGFLDLTQTEAVGRSIRMRLKLIF